MARSSRKLEQARDWALLVGVTATVIILAVAGFGGFGGEETTPVASAPTPTQNPVVNVDNVDDHPFVPTGVLSWAQWEEKATGEVREALSVVAGHSRQETQEWANDETRFGRSFLVELPVGTRITNTGISSAGNWYRVENYIVREGDTLFLTNDKGVPVLKVSCGNPVAPKQDVVERPVPPKPDPCPPRPKPDPCPPKGKNPYPDTIRVHQDSVPLPPRTPGYVPGNAERVRGEQESQPIGGLNPTPSGTPGTGSGGITPPGTTQNPDGSFTVAPPPSSEPPAPPPPLSEVETGAGLPPKPD